MDPSLPFLGDFAILLSEKVSAQRAKEDHTAASTYLQFLVQVPQLGLELRIFFRHLTRETASIRGK